MGFSGKEVVPAMLRVSILLKNSLEFAIFLHTPWNSYYFYSTLFEFSIDILNRWVTDFFLEKLNPYQRKQKSK